MTAASITQATLVSLLAEQLRGQQAAAPTPVQVWVVVFTEEMTAPAIRNFSESGPLVEYLKPLIGKPGFVFVLKGQRGQISVGSLPALYLPDEIIPLFDVQEPVFNDDGSTVVPQAPEIIPETPAIETPEDDIDEPAAVVEGPEPDPAMPAIPSVTPPDQQSPALFGDA